MCFVRPNQTVQAGQVIGEICDIYGNILGATAKEDGLVLLPEGDLGRPLRRSAGLAVASKKATRHPEREPHD